MRLGRFKDAWRGLPVGSMYYPAAKARNGIYTNEGDIKSYLKDTTFHVFYAVVAVTLFGIHSLDSLRTGSLNPFKQREIRLQYSQLQNEVFGTWGLADKDGDGLELSEMADAWNRMGLEDTVLKLNTFTKPTLEELERARDSYRTEREINQ